MRNYTAKKYKKLVERTKDPIFQSWEKTERNIIAKVKNSKNKTFIDLGAGYGRVLPNLAKIAKNVISIEINPAMIGELKRRAKQYKNATVIEGDIQKLLKLLKKENVKNPVLLLTQNTLGTIEGDYKKVLSEMKAVAKKYKGEVIISLFRQEALNNWGIKFYFAIKGMVGEPDLEKTDFGKGLFVSKAGYTSKWWTSAERKEIKDYFGGEVINEIQTPHFWIIHISQTRF